jgi:hypothetical protein
VFLLLLPLLWLLLLMMPIMIIIHDYQSHVAHDAVGDDDDYDDYDFMIMNPRIHDGDVFAKSELKLIAFSLQVSANSDGNLETIGAAGELWVQCGLPSRVKKSSPLFSTIQEAASYDVCTARITMSGS